MGAVRILSVLVYLDAALLPDGLYRLLDEEGQMVGISDPSADDHPDCRIIYGLFFRLSVLHAEVYPYRPVLRLRYDSLSGGDIRKQED